MLVRLRPNRAEVISLARYLLNSWDSKLARASHLAWVFQSDIEHFVVHLLVHGFALPNEDEARHGKSVDHKQQKWNSHSKGDAIDLAVQRRDWPRRVRVILAREGATVSPGAESCQSMCPHWIAKICDGQTGHIDISNGTLPELRTTDLHS